MCGVRKEDGSDLRIVVVGGDRREEEAAAYLASLGHETTHLGAQGAAEPPSDGVISALRPTDAVLGPVLGTNAAGDAFHRAGPQGDLRIDPAWLRACRPGTPWLVGRSGPWLAGAAAELGLSLHLYAHKDEFALRNAVPTAEGAIGEASRRTGRTAWGTPALVVGGGRCARALVARLRALDSPVACAARSAAARAEAELLGAQPVHWDQLMVAAAKAWWVFNTVPAPVISRHLLAAMPPGGVVVDIASAPGGTDFPAAATLGVDAVLLLGIPGRMFPRTSGRILADTVLEILGSIREEGGG